MAFCIHFIYSFTTFLVFRIHSLQRVIYYKTSQENVSKNTFLRNFLTGLVTSYSSQSVTPTILPVRADGAAITTITVNDTQIHLKQRFYQVQLSEGHFWVLWAAGVSLVVAFIPSRHASPEVMALDKFLDTDSVCTPRPILPHDCSSASRCLKPLSDFST